MPDPPCHSTNPPINPPNPVHTHTYQSINLHPHPLNSNIPQLAHTSTERYILQNISHPFLMRLSYAFQSKEKLYMVVDYMAGGELFFWLKKVSRWKKSVGGLEERKGGTEGRKGGIVRSHSVAGVVWFGEEGRKL